MTPDEARKVAAVLAEADSGCVFCVQILADEAHKAFPEFDWHALVNEAGGWDE